MLNLTRAFLTVKDPEVTKRSLHHGIGQRNTHLIGPYKFSQEHLAIMQNGAFQELAGTTGRGHVWSAGEMAVERLLPYLPETPDLFASSSQGKPHLVPISRIDVLGSGTRPLQEAWLRVHVSHLALEESGHSPQKLLQAAAAFGSEFELASDGNGEFALYESKATVPFTQMPKPLGPLREHFDRALIYRYRSSPSDSGSILVSPHADLISMEALTFAVMIHLSNMVRYRPDDVENLRGTKHWWLFSSWVDRACENFLLSISSRLSAEEHVIR